MQTLASFVNHTGLSFGADNPMHKSLPALPGTQRLGGGQVAALADVSPVVSSEDSQVESPCMSQSPTKKTQAGGRVTAIVPGKSKGIVRTGAGGSGDARGSHAHGSQRYPH